MRREATEFPEYLQTGYYLEPTVYVQENPKARICQEEIFGPIVTIIPFDTEEEALQIANDTEYGLNGVVWTENLQRAHRVSHHVRAGTIWVNCWFVRDFVPHLEDLRKVELDVKVVDTVWSSLPKQKIFV